LFNSASTATATATAAEMALTSGVVQLVGRSFVGDFFQLSLNHSQFSPNSTVAVAVTVAVTVAIAVEVAVIVAVA